MEWECLTNGIPMYALKCFFYKNNGGMYALNLFCRVNKTIGFFRYHVNGRGHINSIKQNTLKILTSKVNDDIIILSFKVKKCKEKTEQLL